MSTPNNSSLKSFVYRVYCNILIIMSVLAIISAILYMKMTLQGSESNKKIYEDNLMIVEGDKYNSVEYEWKFVTTKMKKKNISLRLKLLEKEIESSYNLLLEIDKMPRSELGITANHYTDYSNYVIQYFTGVYKKLYSHDSKVFDRVAEVFKEIASEEKLSHIDTVNLVTSMVQNIKYEVPELTSTGVLSPTLCINYRYGDCDTKTLLLLLILRKIGVDCVHFQSEKYHHAMIGINVPSTGEYIVYRGIKYYFLETTSPGWYIGVLPPKVSNKIYWDVLGY